MLKAKIVIEDAEYKFYIDDKSYKVQIFSDSKIGYLNDDEVKKLINSLFEDDKRFYKKENGYDIYLDSNNNKRFIKDGVEDLKLFFLSNGTSAITYITGNKKDGETKRFILGKKSNILLNCTMSFMLFLSSLNLFMFYDNDQYHNNVTNLIYETSELIKDRDLTSNEVMDLIKNSKGKIITKQDKKFLSNKYFIDFVLENTSLSRQCSLRSHITDIDIGYFDEQFKEANPDIAGYYDPLIENMIFIYSAEVQDRDGILAHEYAHLWQYSNKYLYIREACAELMSSEFFDRYCNSYIDQIRRVCVLMEIIGPEPVIECNFKGNPENFENTIKDILGEEEGNKLLNLFLEVPSYEDSMKVNAEIDKYLAKMYNIVYSDDIDNNLVIKDLKEIDAIEKILYHRKYFNKNNHGYYYNYIPLHDKLEKIERIPLHELNFDGIENIFVTIHSSGLPIEFALPNNPDLLDKRLAINPNETVLFPEKEFDNIISNLNNQNAQITVVFKDGSFAWYKNGMLYREIAKRSYPSVYQLFDKNGEEKKNIF